MAVSKRPVWETPAPKGTKTKSLSPTQKAGAKRTAAKAGRRYPNLVDNMRAATKT